MKKSYQSKIALPDNLTFDVIWQDDHDVDIEKVTKFVKSLRAPGWYTKVGDPTRDTREYILNNPTKFGSDKAQSVDPFTNKQRFEWLCSQCKCGTTYGGIDLGHKNNWKMELIEAGVLNAGEAKAVYNNLLNLRIECATCNRSHDWEEI